MLVLRRKARLCENTVMAAGRMGGSLRRESSVIFSCLREAEPVQEAAGDARRALRSAAASCKYLIDDAIRDLSASKAMFQMMGVFAEFERAMIQERVRAGLARAGGEGKHLGRPPIAPALEKRIREALATPGRPGVRVIAKQFGVNPGTVQRISRPFEDSAVGL
jgi:Resolvase, N terminal domain